MTPSDQGQGKDSIQLQTAVRMFVEYLLEHKAILQTAMQEHDAKDGDSAPVRIADGPMEDPVIKVKYPKDRDDLILSA